MSLRSAALHRVYVDTSALVALVCPEPDTARVLEWYRQSQDAVLIYTPWLRTEFASALSIKLRSQHIHAEAIPAIEQVAERVLQTAVCEAVETEDFDAAARLCSQSALNLRGPDALHLSAAQRLGCQSMASLDRVMCQVAVKMGIELVFE